jgi:hypothetical protein
MFISNLILETVLNVCVVKQGSDVYKSLEE